MATHHDPDHVCVDGKFEQIDLNESVKTTGLDPSTEQEFLRAAEEAVAEVIMLNSGTQREGDHTTGNSHEARPSVTARLSHISANLDGMTVLEAVMEKRARPRGMQKLLFCRLIGYPWASRRLTLLPSSKVLKYYSPHGELKGTVEVLGTTCQRVSPDYADGRENAFVLLDGEDQEVLLLAASSAQQCEHWVKMLNILGRLPDDLPSPVWQG